MEIQEEINMSTELKIGEVILDEEKIPYVVVFEENFERMSNCSYDRRYFVCEEKWLREHQGLLCMGELEHHGYYIPVTGLYFPDIERAGVAPYEIKEVKTFNFRQKVAKTKTVTYYE